LCNGSIFAANGEGFIFSNRHSSLPQAGGYSGGEKIKRILCTLFYFAILESMIGFLLVAIGAMFEEAASSIGKFEVAHKKQSLYAMGFLSLLWGTVLLIGVGWYRYDTLVFSFESLPTLVPRIILEITLFFITLHAILKADRSTFAFLRILTLPLLVFTDIALGYSISVAQIAGISLVVFAFLFLFTHHGFSRQGKMLGIISAILAVATISLYKFNITHYNSVEVEQTIMGISIMLTLFFVAWIRAKENLFQYLFKPLFFLQSISAGLGSVLINFAYLFGPASLITTAKRSFSILMAIASGNQYFGEKNLRIKLFAFFLISAGILLMVL
jgi:drug/metabolite transporter (DMT)-like permease